MAIDPRLFTPAAAKNQMLGELSGRVTPFGVRDNMLNQRPTQDSLFGMPSQPPQTTPQDDQQAVQIGTDIFGRSLENVSPEKIATMATDDPEKVDPAVQDIYSRGGEAAKIIGALTQMQEQSDATASLMEQLAGEKTTPEDARAKINEFFDVAPEEKPAWADVALSVGLSLLRGESGTGDFLKDLGIAGQRGVAVSQAAKKERRARSDMLDKLAFGVFREDSKNQKNLVVQLRQFDLDSKKFQRALTKDLTDYITKTAEMDETASKNYANTMVDTINGLPKELKGEAARIIGANTAALSDLPLEELPSSIYALLEREGLNVSAAGLDTGKNIVTTEFTITDPETFADLKSKYPQQFAGFERFNPNATYKVEGFANKVDGGLTSILSVSSTPTKPDTQLGQLQLQRNELRNELVVLDENDPNYARVKQALEETNKAIEKTINTSTGQSFYFDENGALQAISSDGQGIAPQIAFQKQQKVDSAVLNFVRAAGIGDQILQTLARQPPGQEAGPLGVISFLSNSIGGVRGQAAVISGIYDRHSDLAGNFQNRTNLSHLYGNNQKTDSGASVGSVFQKFDELTKDRQDIRSLVYDYAFALAGSRETGKLTDKDVANAMITLGGGDIAEGKWFANADALIRGVNNAINLSANNLGPLFNLNAQTAIKIAISEGTDPDVAEATYRFNPKTIIKNIAMDDTLYTRITFDRGQVNYQPLDKYREDFITRTTAIPLSVVQTLSPAAQQAIPVLKTFDISTQQGKDDAAAFIDTLDPAVAYEIFSSMGQ